MQYLNGSDIGSRLPAVGVESRRIRQLVKAKDVANKLGVSISWVIQHASGKRRPYLSSMAFAIAISGSQWPICWA